MIKLKPCPFCGGEADLIMSTRGIGDNMTTIRNTFVVRCRKCGISGKYHESRIYQTNDGEVHIEATGADEAIKEWNRRTNNE